MNKSHFQISLLSLLLIVLAFAVGYVTSEYKNGGNSLPASTDTIKAGEALSIESLSDPSINREVVVLADLKIDLPLIGLVDVTGNTTASLEKDLDAKFGKFIGNPMINVFRSNFSQGTK